MKRAIAVYVPMIVSLIAFAASGAVVELSLPAIWRVKLDPGEVGMKEKWYDPDLEDKDWQAVSTYKWQGWDKQGLPEHVGLGWYRVEQNIPASMQKKYVYLYFSAVDEEAWVWVNGRSAGEHTCLSEKLKPVELWDKPFALEVTKLVRFGRVNHFAVMVRNSAAMGGVWQPVHLFASSKPLTLKQMIRYAATMNRKILKGKAPEIRYEVWTDYAYNPVFPDSERRAKDTEVSVVQEGSGGSWARNLTGPIRARGACGEIIPLAIHVRNRGKDAFPLRLDFHSVPDSCSAQIASVYTL